MNAFTIVAFFATLAVASAGIIAPSAKILQGPSSKTTLVGPDGSVISSVAPGGKVITEELPGAVAYSAPVVAAAPIAVAHAASVAVAHAAPVAVAHAAPIAVAHAAPIAVAHAAPVAIAPAASIAYGTADVVVAGPSGTIAVGKSIAAPAVVAHQTVAVAPIAQVIVPAGHGLEGEYVHDYAETLYDDGSYKPHLH